MAMKRKAILISSPNADGAKSLVPGTDQDFLNWKKLLQKSSGGAWNEAEIVEYSHEKHGSLCEYVKLLGELEYLFLMYSGHGYRDGVESYIYEDETSSVCLNDLQSNVALVAPKATIIVDACRFNKYDVPYMHMYKVFAGFLTESKDSAKEALWERKLRNSQINGLVTIQSCGLHELSSMQDKNKSSLFSDKMLEATKDPLIETVGDAFIFAEQETKKTAHSWGCLQLPKLSHNGKDIDVSKCSAIDYPLVVK